MHRAFAVAAEDDGAAGDRAGLEVAGVFQFRRVADIDPAMVEDGATLALQHVVRDEHLAIDEERLLLAIFDDEIVARGLVVHGKPLRPTAIYIENCSAWSNMPRHSGLPQSGELGMTRPAMRSHLMLQRDLASLARGLQQGEHDLDIGLGPAAVLDRRPPGADGRDHVVEHLAAAGHGRARRQR